MIRPVPHRRGGQGWEQKDPHTLPRYLEKKNLLDRLEEEVDEEIAPRVERFEACPRRSPRMFEHAYAELRRTLVAERAELTARGRAGGDGAPPRAEPVTPMRASGDQRWQN